MARGKDQALRSVFERYGYDPDDPVRGRDIPDRLLRVLGHTRVIDAGERFDRQSLQEKPPSDVELEALELLACGHSYKEIAAIQHNARETVATRLGVVYRKLGAYNGPHAVALAIAQRLIPRERKQCC